MTDDGTAVIAGDEIRRGIPATASSHTCPPRTQNGSPATGPFTFQVQDDGGTAMAASTSTRPPNTMTINVTAVNDAPTGADNTVSTPEDTAYTFDTADFGFSDPNDNPADSLQRSRSRRCRRPVRSS